MSHAQGRIAIVDDDADVQDSLEFLLGTAGYAGHCQVVGPWPYWCTRSGRTHGSLCQGGNPSDLGPRLEGLGPGGSIVRDRKVIAAEGKEGVDLSMDGEETLSLPGT
jgi:hypothetical protein